MAEDSDTEWIDELVEEWGEDTVRKAFWLQKKIKHEGLDGIHFMEVGEAKAQSQAHLTVKSIVESRLDDEY